MMGSVPLSARPRRPGMNGGHAYSKVQCVAPDIASASVADRFSCTDPLPPSFPFPPPADQITCYIVARSPPPPHLAANDTDRDRMGWDASSGADERSTLCIPIRQHGVVGSIAKERKKEGCDFLPTTLSICTVKGLCRDAQQIGPRKKKISLAPRRTDRPEKKMHVPADIGAASMTLPSARLSGHTIKRRCTKTAPAHSWTLRSSRSSAHHPPGAGERRSTSSE